MKRYRSISFSIIHDDRDLVLIDKPAGLLASPIEGSRARNAFDLLNSYLCPRKEEVHIVHRIDRYTSGLLVFAKNLSARDRLVAQFRAHAPRRTYWALVRGRMGADEGELRHFLRLTVHGFRQVVVGSEQEGGTLAFCRYRLLEAMPEASLLEVDLITGLKNQIRAQLTACGHPIIGDRHYSPSEKEEKDICHQALHARRLRFVHPRTQSFVVFTAPIPPDLARLIEIYRRKGRPLTGRHPREKGKD